jgi:hypothetical protein
MIDPQDEVENYTKTILQVVCVYPIGCRRLYHISYFKTLELLNFSRIPVGSSDGEKFSTIKIYDLARS